MIKKIIFCLTMICLPFLIFTISVSAHESDLGIPGCNDCYYDECIEEHYINSSDIGDGIEEKWYELLWGDIDETVSPNIFDSYVMFHVDDDITTLYYKFQDNGLTQPNTTWYTNISVTNGAEIKQAYEDSMLKWNDVLLYKQNDGFIEKYSIIKLVNYDSLVNKQDVTPNIFIYPYYSTGGFAARTNWIYDTEILNDRQNTNGIWHGHFTQFTMEVNLFSLNNSPLFKSRTGAHEIGHVLGLFDIDTVENPNQSSNYHHEEILMGYSKGNNPRQNNITYKDIAGVAITRGFHTDSDHKWMTNGITTNLGIKLICSLCNITKYVNSLSNIEYVILGSCNNNHTLTSNNMMAVASYENKDYYKCKYCRYVAPFSSNVTQNYSYIDVDNDNYHQVTNNIQGLTYSFTEPHQSETSCNLCGYYHNHSYTKYGKYSDRQHKKICSCGDYILQYHIINGQGSGICVLCGFPASSGGAINPFSINSINYITDNGSYISENGVIVLSDIDYLKFLSGSLDVYALADNIYKS